MSAKSKSTKGQKSSSPSGSAGGSCCSPASSCCQAKPGAVKGAKQAKVGICPCWNCTSPVCDCAPCVCFSE